MGIKERLNKLERATALPQYEPDTPLTRALESLTDEELNELITTLRSGSANSVSLTDLPPAVQNALTVERSQDEH